VEAQEFRAGKPTHTLPSSVLPYGMERSEDSRLLYSQQSNRSNKLLADHSLTKSWAKASTSVQVDILRGGQKIWGREVSLKIERRWYRRMLSFAFHWWHTWATERGSVRHRLRRMKLRLQRLKLDSLLNYWLQQVEGARTLYVARVTRRQELRQAAILMHRTRIRSLIKSVIVAWHAATKRATDLRGRKSATYAAAEAEVEAVAAHAELEVVEEKLHVLREQLWRQEEHINC